MTRAVLRVALIASTATLACSTAPIEWSDPSPLPDSLVGVERLTIAADGSLAAIPADTSVLPPAAPGQCRASVRVARDTTGELYAVWWATRPDSTAEILVSRSATGEVWDAPTRVDTLDAGRTGCRRPPPSIDAWAGHVHVAYAMAAREGPGIFASHSMDKGALYHTPVAVVYGERIGEVSIAARENDVAIVFEDPNSTREHIGLAYSNTMAHLFQHRETVSPSGGSARKPHVALGNGRIAIRWTRTSAGQMTRLVRMGTIQ